VQKSDRRPAAVRIRHHSLSQLAPVETCAGRCVLTGGETGVDWVGCDVGGETVAPGDGPVPVDDPVFGVAEVLWLVGAAVWPGRALLT
jgi:hypothetical protein